MKYKSESPESAVPSQTASPPPPGVELLEPSLCFEKSRDASRRHLGTCHLAPPLGPRSPVLALLTELGLACNLKMLDATL